jgi:hypothetical protein
MSRRLLFLLAFCLGLGLWLSDAPPASAQASTTTNQFKLYLPLVQRDAAPQDPSTSGPTLEAFAATVADGQADLIKGVYVQERLALKVQQQPADAPGYIAPQPDTVTQFSLAAAYNVTGLLAHNFAAGAKFYQLAEGERAWIIYGDGAFKEYQIERIERYQAEEPNSPISNFINLETNEALSATELFMRVYTGDDHVTFQTCFALGGNDSGGRLFVIALPVD